MEGHVYNRYANVSADRDDWRPLEHRVRAMIQVRLTLTVVKGSYFILLPDGAVIS